MIEFSI